MARHILILCIILFPAKVFGKADLPSAAPEHWSVAYKTFHEQVAKVGDQVGRNFFPELMIIRNANTIAAIPVDVFSAKVLKEADEVLLPFREGIQTCVDTNHNEYRLAKNYSYESFGWFLDNYVRTLVKALDSQAEMEIFNGVKERQVTTDRALYAFTRLLGAYLEERRERYQNIDATSFAADTALLTSINDIGRRVFRLELNQKFNREEALAQGMKSQPVFRDLASNEGGADLTLGLDPLARLTQEGPKEPLCKITLPPRGNHVADAQ